MNSAVTDRGQDLDGAAEVEADLCIVGAGPAGLALAHGLAGRGLRILILAGGGRAPTRAGQDTYWGRQSGTRSESLTHARFRAFGGSGLRWAGLCRRLDPEDFAPKPGLPWTGWPITRDDLNPWYDAAESLLDVDGPGEEAGDWAGRLGHLDGLAGDGLRLDVLRFARRPDLSADTRHLDADPGLRVLLGASALRLGPKGEDGRRPLRVRLASGRNVGVAARAIVLACGAVETARLLLASESGAGGVGNAHGMVGRCFFDHLYMFGGHVEGAAPDRLAPLTVSRFGKDADARGGFALWRLSPGPDAPVSAAAFLIPRHAFQRHPDYEAPGGRALRYLAEALRGERVPARDAAGMLAPLLTPSAARSALRHALELKRPDRRPSLRIQAEALPCPDSRITLAAGRCALGLPRVGVHWRTGQAERDAVRSLVGRIAAKLERGGLGHLADAPSGESWPASQTGGKHHMGGARMSDDPARGVVDRDLRVHGETNLFVAGSAVFPTGGWANPTLTIVALSLRLADHLASVLAQGGRTGHAPGPAQGMVSTPTS